MRATIQIAVSLLCLVSYSEAKWEDGHVGTDRGGVDLPDMPISLNLTSIPSDCARLCIKEPKCVAWVYHEASAQHRLCYLKKIIEERHTLDPSKVSGVKNAKLLPLKYVPLPLSSIKPTGWLKQQLQVQRNGLSGHLPLFWADVQNSSWIGGKEDLVLHERFPYWLNGFIPMAYQLEDKILIDLVGIYVNYILDHQSADGWLGPDDDSEGNQYWSKFPMLLALRQYYEATGEERVITAMFRFLKAAHNRMMFTPFGYSWSGARWQDLVLTIHWLLDNYPNGNEQFLWDLANLAHQQGFDWRSWFTEENILKTPTPGGQGTYYTHGVNNGQAIKTGGVWYRQSQDIHDYLSAYETMRVLDKYHGQANGVFGCDEHLAGKHPSRGTELCTVVETMFSYEVLYSITGDPIFAERAEMVGLNALPATLTDDMWAHQYLQQVNSPMSTYENDHIWTNDGAEAILYGLEPNDGCCTVNFNQGWPKYIQNLVMATQDGGLVVGMYSPVSAQLKGSNGRDIFVDIVTDYPFDEHVYITITSEEDEPIPAYFRVPSWADNATFTYGGGSPEPAINGTHHLIHCSKGNTSIIAYFNMRIRLDRRYNNAASIYRGPLLYALYIKEKFLTVEQFAFKSQKFFVIPESQFNLAIVVRNDSKPEDDINLVVQGVRKSVPPFSKEGVPVQLFAKKGCVLEHWGMEQEEIQLPVSPVRGCSQSNEVDKYDIELRPYGSTKLRVGEIPTLPILLNEK